MKTKLSYSIILSIILLLLMQIPVFANAITIPTWVTEMLL